MNQYPRLFDSTPGAFRHFSVEVEGDRDPASVVDMVGKAFKPHKMAIIDRERSLDATFRSLKLGDLQIFYLKYGAEVRVDPGDLGDFTLIQMPVCGVGNFSYGSKLVSGSRDVAAVLSPREATKMEFSPELRQIIVRIEQRALEQACVEYAGVLPERGLRFDPMMDLAGAAGRAWCSALTYVLEGSVAFPDLFNRRAYAERCERLLVDSLILTQPSNFSDLLSATPLRRTVRPGYVKRAEEYMRAHLAEISSVDEIAHAVGVSTRTLFYAFRQTHDRSPMSYLRELRLKAVHAELRSSAPGTTRLTEVVMRLGFAHYGHFASQYRRLFGVRPQDTLNAARG